MNISIKPHTILMMVGPSGCGKTTFAKEVIINQLRDKVKVNYISSDDLRMELLGLDNENIVDKDSPQMLEVSSLAFDLLHAKLDAYTSYPVNSEVVIVDTKGLSEEFRQEILQVGRKNNYNVDVVVFNFKKMSDYYENGFNNKLIESNVRRLRTKVLKELTMRKYNNIHSIDKKDFSGYKVEIQDYEFYKSHFLPEEYDYLVVGDIHECLNEFVNLLEGSGFILEDGKIVGNSITESKRVVLVGDYIDKGNNTKEILDFMYDNKDWIYFVKGNHEEYLERILNGEVSEDKITDKKLYYFSSIKFFKEADEEMIEKFKELLNISRSFFVSKNPKNSTFYVTHAPCKKKYVGKIDKKSIKRQINLSIDYDFDEESDFKKSLEKQLEFLQEEKGMNEPFHIFGHIATLTDYRVGNSIGIDTGCVFGNRLTGVGVGYGRVFYHSVKSGKEVTMKLPEVFKRSDIKKVNLSALDKSEYKKLRYAANNKINFISGTMSPSDKDMEKGILESLDKGLDYFKDKGVNKVILQPKYMGSRCNVYLFKDNKESYAVSRNGFIIKRLDVNAKEEFIKNNIDKYDNEEDFNRELEMAFGGYKDLEGMFEKLHSRYSDYMEENNLNMILLDGELLPWSVLGAGLIENSFKPVEAMVSNELDILSKYGFMENFEKAKLNFEESNFRIDQNNLNKKELIKKYGNRDYSNFKSLNGANHESVDNLRSMINTYKEQLSIFSDVEEEPYLESFNVLKMVDNNGDNVFFEGNNEDLFKFVSDNDYVVVDLSDEKGYKEAKDFFELLTLERKMEGVVIKPLVNENNVLPFIKVRNEDYLMLVYGYDYKLEEKYNRLLKQKNIRRKVKASFKEHYLGQRMLDVRYEDINKDNEHFMRIIANLILEIREESNIDPRL